MATWRITNVTTGGVPGGVLLLRGDAMLLLRPDGDRLALSGPESVGGFWPLLDSVQIYDARPCAVATFGAQLVNDDAVSKGDEILVEYAADDSTFVSIFGGDCNILKRSHLELLSNRLYDFQARDFTARLDWTVISTGGKRPVETAADRLAWLAAYAPTHDITDGGIDDFSATEVGEFDYTGMTKTEALQNVAGFLQAYFYVDFDKELQVYTTRSLPADFALTTDSPSAPTSYSYHDFDINEDVTTKADYVFVQGEEISVWRPSTPPFDDERQSVINDTSIKDLETANARGDLELTLIGEAMVSGDLITHQPGLTAGQTVNIVNSAYSIDDDYIITGVRTRPLQASAPASEGVAEFAVSFSDRYACSPSSNSGDLARTDINDGNADTSGHKLVIITGASSATQLQWGKNRGIYVGVDEASGEQLYRFTPQLQRVFKIDVANHIIWDHVPDEGNDIPRALPVGDLGILPDGTTYFDFTDVVSGTILGVAVQDRPRYWVLDDTSTLSLIESDGSFVDDVAVADAVQLASTPSGQYVGVMTWDSVDTVVKFYSRNLTLAETVTLAGIDAHDNSWAADDNFNLYVNHAGDLLTRYTTDGAKRWQTDMTTFDSFNSNGLMLIDGDAVRTPGFKPIGGGDNKAVLLSVSTATGSLLGTHEFEATDGSGSHVLRNVVRNTKTGPLIVCGESAGGPSNIEGESYAVAATWLARLEKQQDTAAPEDTGGAVESPDAPYTVVLGRRFYVGTSTPTGAREGDVWING